MKKTQPTKNFLKTKEAAPKPLKAKSKTQKTGAKSAAPKNVRSVVAEIMDPEIPLVQGELVQSELVTDELVKPTRTAKPAANPQPPIAQSRGLTISDPVTQYLNEIRKYPVLTKEEEKVWAERYAKTKDPQAAQILVTSNLRFVVKIAAEYARFGARMIDLIQEGNIGLMHAVREFDYTRDVRLITYAVWWIRGYIQEYLMKQYSLVKIGTTQAQKKLFYQLQKEKQNLDAMGFSPSAAQIGSRLGVAEKDVNSMSQRLSGRDVSLDAPLDDESSASLMDLQKAQVEAPDEVLAREEMLEKLRLQIDQLRPLLTAREAIILDERLLNDEPLTLQEIGEKYGITREAVRQMEVRLMNKIRLKMQNLS